MLTRMPRWLPSVVGPRPTRPNTVRVVRALQRTDTIPAYKSPFHQPSIFTRTPSFYVYHLKSLLSRSSLTRLLVKDAVHHSLRLDHSRARRLCRCWQLAFQPMQHRFSPVLQQRSICSRFHRRGFLGCFGYRC